MNLADIYSKISGNYGDVLSRLGKDERITKYLKMFADGNDCDLIEKALSSGNYEEVFRSVHNLKGVAANLGLSSLFDASDKLCEAVRHGKPDGDISDMVATLKKEYAAVKDALGDL